MMLPAVSLVLALASLASAAPTNGKGNGNANGKPFVHPGLSHSAEDLERVKFHVNAGHEPWVTGFEKLTNNTKSHLGYKPAPEVHLCRGANAGCQENYAHAMTDFAACYQHAIRWKITGDDRYADGAVQILNAWSSSMKTIAGHSPDRFLAAGIYGYEYAECVELLRDYPGFTAENLAAAVTLLTDVFWPNNKDFLENHVNGNHTFYWANWDQANMASALAIGVVAENRDIFNYAIDYFYNGIGQGSIHHWLWKVYDDGTAQVQESGRDQAHAMLDFALMGPFLKTALHQGLDLWAYEDNLILKGAEYVTKYNLGHDVQYTPYLTINAKGQVEWNQTVISEDKRGPEAKGNIRPIWEMYYNEYVVKRGLPAPYVQQYADITRRNGSGAEGGGGDYEKTSGGYDQLGFGTLLYTLPGSVAVPEGEITTTKCNNGVGGGSENGTCGNGQIKTSTSAAPATGSTSA